MLQSHLPLYCFPLKYFFLLHFWYLCMEFQFSPVFSFSPTVSTGRHKLPILLLVSLLSIPRAIVPVHALFLYTLFISCLNYRSGLWDIQVNCVLFHLLNHMYNAEIYKDRIKITCLCHVVKKSLLEQCFIK